MGCYSTKFTRERERTARDLLLVLLADLENTVDLNLNAVDLILYAMDLNCML
jgi:hypothetical protein